MKYLVSWSLPQATYNVALARFPETGAAPSPGVRVFGRRHRMSGQGSAVAKSDDARALVTCGMCSGATCCPLM